MPRALMCKTTRLYCLKQVSRGDFSRLRPQYTVRRICIRRKRTVHNRPTALPASAGLLYETDKSSLDAFSERQNDVASAILTSSSLNSLTELIVNE